MDNDDETNDLLDLLSYAGFEVVTGKEDVSKMIQDKAGTSYTQLCSGYGVFPDGSKCRGCADCTQGVSDD